MDANKEKPMVVNPNGKVVRMVEQNRESFSEYIFDTINLHRAGMIDDSEAVTRALLVGRVQKQADLEMKYAYLTKKTPSIPLLEN